MFVFSNDFGGSFIPSLLACLVVFAALFALNEVTRRSKWAGFAAFVVLPIVLTVLWFTSLKDSTYLDWFHLAKVYSSTAGCIGFWCIRFVHGTAKNGKQWKLSEKKWALCFPPLILAINIVEACVRDFEVGSTYASVVTAASAFKDGAYSFNLIGGPWNFMNGIAGILNILTITGWLGICIRKETAKDKSHDMLWPDMVWFWIVAYDLWNFAYTYNCLPSHSWYCGLALLLAPTCCAFTVGKGAWLQHRAQTLALWCMFAQTFPTFQDASRFRVDSAYNPAVYNVISGIALAFNLGVFVYMLVRVIKAKKSP